jgi:hypothetical protein
MVRVPRVHAGRRGSVAVGIVITSRSCLEPQPVVAPSCGHFILPARLPYSPTSTSHVRIHCTASPCDILYTRSHGQQSNCVHSPLAVSYCGDWHLHTALRSACYSAGSPGRHARRNRCRHHHLDDQSLGRTPLLSTWSRYRLSQLL